MSLLAALSSLALVHRLKSSSNGVNGRESSEAQVGWIFSQTALVLLLIDAAIERAPKSNPRSVSDTIWSCATLRYLPPRMLTPLLSQVSHNLDKTAFEAQHLSLITWSLAVLECKPVRLLERIEALTVKLLHTFNPQNCANIMWGFAKRTRE